MKREAFHHAFLVKIMIPAIGYPGCHNRADPNRPGKLSTAGMVLSGRWNIARLGIPLRPVSRVDVNTFGESLECPLLIMKVQSFAYMIVRLFHRNARAFTLI